MGTMVYWWMKSFFTHRPHYLTTGKIESVEKMVGTDNLNGGFEYSACFLYVHKVAIFKLEKSEKFF